MKSLTVAEALIYIMVSVSAVDRSMSDDELQRIGNIVTTLPVFHDFDPDDLINVSQECTRLLQTPDGLNNVLASVTDALVMPLRETAYALAVEIAAADGIADPSELKLLQMISQQMQISRLSASAIQFSAHARYQRATTKQ